jgi:hypothetical protein
LPPRKHRRSAPTYLIAETRRTRGGPGQPGRRSGDSHARQPDCDHGRAASGSRGHQGNGGRSRYGRGPRVGTSETQPRAAALHLREHAPADDLARGEHSHASESDAIGRTGRNEVRVEGGEFESGVERAEVSPQIARRALTASATVTPFGVERYELNPEEENGSLDLQAGSHPFKLTTTLELNRTYGRDPAHPEVELPAAPALLRNLIPDVRQAEEAIGAEARPA